MESELTHVKFSFQSARSSSVVSLATPPSSLYTSTQIDRSRKVGLGTRLVKMVLFRVADKLGRVFSLGLLLLVTARVSRQQGMLTLL
jgi:hypothetical protein